MGTIRVFVRIWPIRKNLIFRHLTMALPGECDVSLRESMTGSFSRPFKSKSSLGNSAGRSIGNSRLLNGLVNSPMKHYVNVNDLRYGLVNYLVTK